MLWVKHMHEPHVMKEYDLEGEMERKRGEGGCIFKCGWRFFSSRSLCKDIDWISNFSMGFKTEAARNKSKKIVNPRPKTETAMPKGRSYNHGFWFFIADSYNCVVFCRA